MKKKAKRYDEDFKKSSVELFLKSDKKQKEFARELGVISETFRGWLSKYREFCEAEPVTDQEKLNQYRRKLISIDGESIAKKDNSHLLKKPGMKFEIIKTNRSKYPVEKMCKILNVSRSGFYKWLKKSPINNNLVLMALIKTIYEKSRRTYGYLRITEALRKRGLFVNKKKVARIIHEMGIFGLQIKRFRPKTTISNHNYPISPNLVGRNFGLKDLCP